MKCLLAVYLNKVDHLSIISIYIITRLNNNNKYPLGFWSGRDNIDIYNVFFGISCTNQSIDNILHNYNK